MALQESLKLEPLRFFQIVIYSSQKLVHMSMRHADYIL